MNIFDFAKKMESDGESYYRKLAASADSAGLKRIMESLADAEALHYQALLEMEKGESGAATESTLLDQAKNIFADMPLKDFAPDFSFPQVDAYAKALAVEKQSIDFYKSKAAELTRPEQRDIFLRLAWEEQEHYFLVDNILEFMLRPYQWLENAEFNHLDEY